MGTYTLNLKWHKQFLGVSEMTNFSDNTSFELFKLS